MSHDNNEVDFGAPLPPEVPDGHYKATVSTKNEGKLTAAGDPIAFIEFKMTENLDSDGDEGVTGRASVIFMPKGADHKFFRSFMQEVQNVSKACKVDPPRIPRDAVGDMAAWTGWLAEVNGTSDVEVWVTNKEDKTGESRAKVYFQAPKGKKGPKIEDDGDDPMPTGKGKKGKK